MAVLRTAYIVTPFTVEEGGSAQHRKQSDRATRSTHSKSLSCPLTDSGLSKPLMIDMSSWTFRSWSGFEAVFRTLKTRQCSCSAIACVHVGAARGDWNSGDRVGNQRPKYSHPRTGISAFDSDIKTQTRSSCCLLLTLKLRY